MYNVVVHVLVHICVRVGAYTGSVCTAVRVRTCTYQVSDRTAYRDRPYMYMY